MKKTSIRVSLLLSIATICCLLLVACGCEHTFDDGVVTQEATCTVDGIKTQTCTKCGKTKEVSIPKIPHDYDEVITKEATFDESGTKTYTCKVCGDTYTEELPVKEKTVTVTCIDKRNSPKDTENWQFSDRVILTFKLQNDCDTPVKGVEGTLLINDLFGKKILELNCDFTGNTIPAHSAITVDDLGLDINEFMDSHTKLYNTDFSDLEFIYSINNIVYSNDTSTTTEQTHNDAKVTVVVKDKTNIPKDTSNWQFSNRVQFVLDVTNETAKDIKGVSGVLVIKDLFGKDIKKLQCDFTGQTIPAGSTTTFTDLGYDINEFMDEDVKCYNEDFSDLNFEYEVQKVVYSDGTSEEM